MLQGEALNQEVGLGRLRTPNFGLVATSDNGTDLRPHPSFVKPDLARSLARADCSAAPRTTLSTRRSALAFRAGPQRWRLVLTTRIGLSE